MFGVTAACGADEPEWVEPMKKVHAGFRGKQGYVSQLGDSITTSLAFWSPLGWDEPQQYLPKDDGLPLTPKDRRWRDVILGTRDKGPQFGNNGGWRVENLLEVIDDVLKKQQPETAVIMIGTNDIGGKRMPEKYEAGVQTVVDKCLAAHCVPLLTTIPPREGHDEAVAGVNKIVRAIAKEKQIPLIDYHAAIVERQPDGKWLGTLIDRDGVHPTAGKTNVYSAENLQNDGYALRNWVTFLTYREVYFRVLQP
jgi:lysophospholipase L1-like esterase